MRVIGAVLCLVGGASSVALAAPGIEDSIQAFSIGEYAAAEKSLTELTAGDDWAEASLWRARLQWETGQYAKAEATAARVAGNRRLGLAAETVRGEAQHARGLLDEAARTWPSVARAPGAHRARVLLGKLLIERGRRTEAEPHLMALIPAADDALYFFRPAA